MRRFINVFFMAALLLLLTSIPAFAAGISLSVDAPQNVQRGQVFNVNLNLADPTNCNGLEFYLQYDAAKVRPIAQNDVYFVRSSELSNALMLPVTSENPIIVVAGLKEPISWMGSRSIGTIQFEAISDGIADFKFIRTKYVNASYTEEGLPSENGSVTIGNPPIGPKVTLNESIDGTTINRTILAISGSIEDASKLWINDRSLVFADNQWSTQVNLQEGRNEIRISASDDLGNTSTYTYVVYCDTQVSYFQIINDSFETNQSTYVLRGTVEYCSPLSSVWISRNTSTVAKTIYAQVYAPTVGNSVYSTWSTTVSLDEGQNKFTVFAKDAIGNTKESSELVIIRNSGTTNPGGDNSGGGGGSSGGTIELPPVAKPNQTYLDLPGHWAQKTVERLVYLEVIDGYPDGNFYPDKQLSRLEAATLLSKALGLQPISEQDLQFSDNQDIPQWAKGWVAVAVKEGIIKGYGQPDGSTIFKGNQQVSRVELAAMIARALEKRIGNITPDKLQFADNDTIPTWAIQDLGIALNQKVVAGYPDNTFRANQSVTRAEAATMVLRLLEKLKS